MAVARVHDIKALYFSSRADCMYATCTEWPGKPCRQGVTVTAGCIGGVLAYHFPLPSFPSLTHTACTCHTSECQPRHTSSTLTLNTHTQSMVRMRWSWQPVTHLLLKHVHADLNTWAVTSVNEMDSVGSILINQQHSWTLPYYSTLTSTSVATATNPNSGGSHRTGRFHVHMTPCHCIRRTQSLAGRSMPGGESWVIYEGYILLLCENSGVHLVYEHVRYSQNHASTRQNGHAVPLDCTRFHNLCTPHS